MKKIMLTLLILVMLCMPVYAASLDVFVGQWTEHITLMDFTEDSLVTDFNFQKHSGKWVGYNLPDGGMLLVYFSQQQQPEYPPVPQMHTTSEGLMLTGAFDVAMTRWEAQMRLIESQINAGVFQGMSPTHIIVIPPPPQQ